MTDIRRLTYDDVDLMRRMNSLFAAAFEDAETYASAPPHDDWLIETLARDEVIALAALEGREIVGAVTAYELFKLEQSRREIYIYDLAVDAAWRRRGVATALISQLQAIAAERKAWMVFVQADYGDEPAIALYTKLGTREDVMHFDIPVAGGTEGA